LFLKYYLNTLFFKNGGRQVTRDSTSFALAPAINSEERCVTSKETLQKKILLSGEWWKMQLKLQMFY